MGGRPPLETNQQVNEVSNSKTSSLVNSKNKENRSHSDKNTDSSECPPKLATKELNNKATVKPQAKSSFSICTGDLKRTQRDAAIRRDGKEITACMTDHSKSSDLLGLQSKSTTEIVPTSSPNTVDSTSESLTSLLSASTKSDLNTPSQQFRSAEKEITPEKDPSLQAAGIPEERTSSLASQFVSPDAASEPLEAQSDEKVLDCCQWVGENHQSSNILHFNKAYLRVMPSSRCQFTPMEVQSFLQTQHTARRFRQYDQPSHVMHDFNTCTPHVLGPRRVLSQTRGVKSLPSFTQNLNEEALNTPAEQLLSTHCLGPGRGRSETVRRKGMGVGAVEILLNHHNSPMQPRPKGHRLIGPLAEHIRAFHENTKTVNDNDPLYLDSVWLKPEMDKQSP